LGTPISLRCRECGKEHPPEKLAICQDCFAPLDVEYDLARINLRGDSFQNRSRNIWRYFELLPVLDRSKVVDLQTGFTPLITTENLAGTVRTRKLYVKNDSVNPTFSFKDRPAEVAVSKALEFGDPAVCCVSTGNLGAAVAAHAAKARLPSYILAPSDIELAKISQILAYGGGVISVEGTYDDANRLAVLASDELGWNVVNVTSRPYYGEGSKTIAFELCEQFGWTPPDNVVIPVASGALLRAIHVGFKQFLEVGLINQIPRIFGAQAEGCSPVARAFREGRAAVEPIELPNTIAKSIAIGDPGDGKYALEIVRETHGAVESATDSEIVRSIFELAKSEGIFTEPAGAVTIAVVKKLLESGVIARDESTVCCVTGNGLKTNEIVFESKTILRPPIIKPNIRALRELLPVSLSVVNA
jgi:threonine synthase